ncbi:MAG TPA: FAD-binding protein [Acidimicrobiales bacterium]|jgi:3-oxo-5alpha-steroid 4-dehydrogenase|nr:FAD-binding protein [Acidimicrobiales bacterium]
MEAPTTQPSSHQPALADEPIPPPRNRLQRYLTAEPPDTSCPVHPPLILGPGERMAWDMTCDTLVLGFGAAGAAAAIGAREGGDAVVVADRFDGGGATAKSGGVIYAGGTRYQKALGFEDTPTDMFNYLTQEVRGAVSDATLRKFCEDSAGLIEWVASLGADFESTAPPSKTSYPAKHVHLYYSGNEGVPAYAASATPNPRGHRPAGKGMSGAELFEVLKRRVEELDIPVLRQSAARRLIVDADTGRVIGAELWRIPPGSAAARRHDRLIRTAERWHRFAAAYSDRQRKKAFALERRQAKSYRVQATKKVVLTTGGFIFNRQMVGQYAPRFGVSMRLGTTGCDGSGIRLGQSVGGATALMDKVSAWRFINPPAAEAHGVAVNDRGERFCNEEMYGASLGEEIYKQGNGKTWLILDRRLVRRVLKDACFGRLWWFQSMLTLLPFLWVKRGRTPEELARRLGVPPTTLRATLEENNAAAAGTVPDPVGKSSAMRTALSEAPFYALDIGATSYPLPALTLGGLQVNEVSGAVLTGDGRPISGLFAAGRCSAGLCGNGYVSGLSLADCLWTGWRAARAPS